MKHVISSSIERLVSFALFTLGIAAVAVAAAALLLIIGDTLGHAWEENLTPCDTQYSTP
jgi:hypothetical protein